MRQRDSPNRASARGETATRVHVAVVGGPASPDFRVTADPIRHSDKLKYERGPAP